MSTSSRPKSELTEDEILERFGNSGLMWEALVAFGEDPTYFALMVEEANRRDASRTKGRQPSEPAPPRPPPEPCPKCGRTFVNHGGRASHVRSCWGRAEQVPNQ